MRRRAIGLVAEREIRERLRTKSFWWITGILLVIALAAVILPSVLDDAGPDRSTIALSSGSPSGLGDALVAAGRAQGREIELRDLPAVRAEAAARDGDVDAALIGAGAEGPVRVVVDDELSNTLRLVISQGVSESRLRASLGGVGVPAERIDELTAPPELTVAAVGAGADIEGGDVALGVILSVVLYMALLFSGSLVASGVAEEKTSRVSEVLLATLRPAEILLGKVLGIGLTSLLQLSLAATPAVVAGLVSDTINLPSATAEATAAAVVWFAAGYALYSVAFGALGALVGRQQEVGQAIAPLSFLLLAGYLIAAFSPANPDSGLVQATSLIPVFAPMVMPLRVAAGTVPAWEFALSLALTLGLAAVIAWIGASIYRGGIVQGGPRQKLGQVIRARLAARGG